MAGKIKTASVPVVKHAEFDAERVGPHIADISVPVESMVYRMLCGEEVIVFDDLTTVPAAADWYHPDFGGSAKCDRCLAVWAPKGS